MSTLQKYCPDCQELRSVEEFGKNRTTKDGLTAYCRPHHNERGRASLERKGGSRDYHLKRRYGVCSEDIERMVVEQGGVCAICRTEYPTHLDHDHATDRMRGVLCVSCNNGLGLFKDSADRLEAAALYLKGGQ